MRSTALVYAKFRGNKSVPLEFCIKTTSRFYDFKHVFALIRKSQNQWSVAQGAKSRSKLSYDRSCSSVTDAVYDGRKSNDILKLTNYNNTRWKFRFVISAERNPASGCTNPNPRKSMHILALRRNTSEVSKHTSGNSE